MSTLKVEICNIEEIQPHNNADKLEMARIKGWYCVVGKGNFKIGDKCCYIPIDSVLPKTIEDILFPEGSKIKLDKGRIRTIKIRGNISQGMICTLNSLGLSENLKIGTDITKELGIIKYEPPVDNKVTIRGFTVSKKQSNPYFRKYTEIENIKNYNNIFTEEDVVVITEKIHGTNARFGYLPTEANTWYKKIFKFFKLLPEYEYAWGSHNVQLQDRINKSGYYSVDVYTKIFKQYNLKDKLKPNMIIFGEIVGDGIQKNYTYGCKQGEHKLYIFDIMENGNYVDYARFIELAKELDLETVPTLYIGKFNYDKAKELTQGDSVICPTQKVREGIVIKSIKESIYPRLGRKILKFINDEYLLNKTNTDNH